MLDHLIALFFSIYDGFCKRIPVGAARSSRWPAVARAHLKENPRCACCGGTKLLRVHHKVPFHVAPELELDPNNLITLCEAKKYGINCHFLLGHFGNWMRYNENVEADVAIWSKNIRGESVEPVSPSLFPEEFAAMVSAMHRLEPLQPKEPALYEHYEIRDEVKRELGKVIDRKQGERGRDEGVETDV